MALVAYFVLHLALVVEHTMSTFFTPIQVTYYRNGAYIPLI